jgi:hypothetical protein
MIDDLNRCRDELLQSVKRNARGFLVSDDINDEVIRINAEIDRLMRQELKSEGLDASR